MAISESDRHELHDRLIRALGPEAAGTLMGYLPPVGWADVATKRDLEVLATELRAEMAALRFELKAEIASVSNRLFFQMLGLQMSAAALVVAVTHLT
jgi:hypothetical protein